MADSAYSLPKLPVRPNVVPPAIQLGIAEIIEETDDIIKKKADEASEVIADILIESGIQEEAEIIAVIYPDYKMVKEAFSAFAKKQTPSTSALLNMFEPVIEGFDVKVSMHKANINLVEPIKIEWQKFLKQFLNMENIVMTLIEDDTVIQQTKAYTQREQLDELTKENPLMKELVRKLNLKLK